MLGINLGLVYRKFRLLGLVDWYDLGPLVDQQIVRIILARLGLVVDVIVRSLTNIPTWLVVLVPLIGSALADDVLYLLHGLEIVSFLAIRYLC